MRWNNNGQVESIPDRLLQLGVVILVGVFMAVVLSNYQDESFRDLAREEAVIADAVVQKCVAAAGTGVVDPSLITRERLASCFEKESLGYDVSLQSLTGAMVASAGVLSPQQKAYLSVCENVRAYACVTRKSYVLYQRENDQLPGVFTLRVISRVG